MAEDGAAPPAPPAPVIVELDPITGVPAEYNEFLPQDSAEYKRWKAAQAEGAAQEGIEKLAVKEGEAGAEGAAAATAAAAPDAAPKPGKGGKSKSKAKAIVIETKERQKNKSVTSVSGMEGFGIKLSEAAKIFGKKFACGASVIKTPSQTEQIEMQGDYLQQIPDLIIKNYATSHGVKQEDIFYV